MAKNHGVTKRNRRPISGKRVDQGAETMRILKVRALVAELDAGIQRRLEQIHIFFPEESIKAAFLRREDIKALPSEEQECRWAKHVIRMEEFFTKIAGMDPIFVETHRMPEIMIEEGIDTTDIPEVRDWSGAVRGKFVSKNQERQDEVDFADSELK